MLQVWNFNFSHGTRVKTWKFEYNPRENLKIWLNSCAVLQIWLNSTATLQYWSAYIHCIMCPLKPSRRWWTERKQRAAPRTLSTTDTAHYGDLRSDETQIVPLGYTLTEAHLTWSTGVKSQVRHGTLVLWWPWTLQLLSEACRSHISTA